MKSMYFTDLIGRNATITVLPTADSEAATHSGKITHFLRETEDTNDCFLELDNVLLISVRYIVYIEFEKGSDKEYDRSFSKDKDYDRY